MTDAELDGAILSFLSSIEGRWRKVASVISRVEHASGSDWQDGDGMYERVAGRIEALVGQGRLEAQGNLKNWRVSEVRLPPEN